MASCADWALLPNGTMRKDVQRSEDDGLPKKKAARITELCHFPFLHRFKNEFGGEMLLYYVDNLPGAVCVRVRVCVCCVCHYRQTQQTTGTHHHFSLWLKLPSFAPLTTSTELLSFSFSLLFLARPPRWPLFHPHDSISHLLHHPFFTFFPLFVLILCIPTSLRVLPLAGSLL